MSLLDQKSSKIRIGEVIKGLEPRDFPVVPENASIEDVLFAIVNCRHSRMMNVVNDRQQLMGTISLDALIRHVFAQDREPTIHAPKPVRRYLGISLLPQAGVAIGLVLHARGQLGGGIENHANASQAMVVIDYFVNAVLASVVINELLTPFLLRFALVRAGEAGNNNPGNLR